MLENNEIDRLFKNELTQTREFDNRQSQWKVVYARLNKKKRSLLFWFVPFLLVSLTFIFFIGKNDLKTTNKITLLDKSPIENKSQIEANLKSQDLSVSTSSDKPNTLKTNEEPKKENSQAYNSPLNNQKANNNNNNVNQVNQQKNASDRLLVKKTKDKYLFGPTLPSKVNLHSNQGSILNKNATESIEGYERQYGEKLNLLSNQNISKHELLSKEIEAFNILPIPLVQLLPLKNTKYLLEIVSICHFPASPTKMNRSRFSLSSGLFMEALSQDSIIDSRHLGWSIGMHMNISKASFHLGIKHNKIERYITSSLQKYKLEDSNFVYGYERQDSAIIMYNKSLMDLSIGYNLISRGRFSWTMVTGVQVRAISSGSAKFVYGGAYNPLISENILPSQKFHFSDILFGSTFQYLLYNRIALTLQYNLAVPLEVESIKWPKRHQFELGLTYHLN